MAWMFNNLQCWRHLLQHCLLQCMEMALCCGFFILFGYLSTGNKAHSTQQNVCCFLTLLPAIAFAAESYTNPTVPRLLGYSSLHVCFKDNETASYSVSSIHPSVSSLVDPQKKTVPPRRLRRKQSSSRRSASKSTPSRCTQACHRTTRMPTLSVLPMWWKKLAWWKHVCQRCQGPTTPCRVT